MDATEQLFRNTPKNSKKYSSRLIKYIEHLVSKNRLLEAKHFFKMLYECKPHHLKTIKLGYQISIATFDNGGVKKFDRMLFDLQTQSVDVYYYRLCFYFSANDEKGMEECALALLEKKVNPEQLKLIVQVCLLLENYIIAKKLIGYFKKHQLKPTKLVERDLNQIFYRTLVILLKAAQYEKISNC